MIKKLLDNLTGNRDEMFIRYARLREFDADNIISSRKKLMLRLYIMLALLMLLILLKTGADIYEAQKGYVYKSGKLVSVTRDDENVKTVRVNATIGNETKKLDLLIEPSMEEEEEKEEPDIIQEAEPDPWAEIETAVKDDPAKSRVVLPAVLSDGTRVSYERINEHRFIPVIVFGIMLFIVIYRMRFDALKKDEAEARASVMKELPGFISKLGLLLKSGTVLEDCFRKIITAHTATTDGQSYFYDRLSIIDRNVRNSNSSYIDEIEVFAKESGVHEFIRLANIINDGAVKGVDLTEKLDNEGRYLWYARKSQAEELGKLADTKLTFPLVILLLSLVVIAVAPAMLRM